MKFFIKRFSISLVIITVFCNLLNGQVDTLYSSETTVEYSDESINKLRLVEFSFTNNLPLNGLARNISNKPSGFRFGFYKNHFNKDNLFWGIHYSTYKLDKLQTSYFFEQREFISTTKTKLNFTGLGLRYYLGFYTPKFEPFVEIKAGINHSVTKTNELLVDSDLTSLFYEDYNISFAYAVALGLQYNVRLGQALHFKVNYFDGPISTYHLGEDLGFDYSWDNFSQHKTAFTYIQYNLGITLGF